MFKRVLITLDGSEVSETVLPLMTWLAGAAGFEEVVLFHALEYGGDPAEPVAEGYLEQRALAMRKTWRDAGIPGPRVSVKVGRSVLTAPVDVVLRYAESNGVDLIALCTHGRSGFTRWLLGSSAEKIVRAADVPVLLVRPEADHARGPATPIRRIVAPLDGSELAHRAVGPVEALAKAIAAKVTLLHVAPGPQPASKPGRKPGISREEEEVRLYLSQTVASLKGGGLDAETKVRVGAPSEEIMAEASEAPGALVAISTHGRTGLSRWAMGSVADQVARASQAPVLLIRATPQGPASQHPWGPPVPRCHNCGRITHQERPAPQDRCSRCGYFLRACRNCTHYDGTECVLQLPDAADAYRGQECPRFTFRESPITLR